MKRIESYARFYAILNKMDVHGDREELKQQLVHQYTSGRTESLKEMRVREYESMCTALQRSLSGSPSEGKEELKKKRSACLHLMQELGVNTANWDCVDEFCLDSRIAGKKFACISLNELHALAKRLRAIKTKVKSMNKSAAPKPSRHRKPTLLVVPGWSRAKAN